MTALGIIDQPALQAGPLLIDPARHEASVAGRSVTFTALEMRIVYVLAAYPGQVFTADRLCDVVWGEGEGRHPALRVHLKRIRDKLGEHRHLIEAVRGVGYRWTVKGRGYKWVGALEGRVEATPEPDSDAAAVAVGLAEGVAAAARVLAGTAEADREVALKALRADPVVRWMAGGT